MGLGRILIGAAGAMLASLPLLPGEACASAVSLCDDAARRAASETGVPLEILRAISRVESGRRTPAGFGPWPWTVNEAGEGHFFPTLDEAVLHVEAALSEDRRNIDIGCFQINIRWHSREFPSLDAMFDPQTNALYAARHLLDLLDETGSWEAAVGAYHSRQPEAAAFYTAKVEDQMNASPDALPVLADEAPPDRPRMVYPLFGGGGGVLGSLVAQEARAAIVPLLR